MSQMDELQRSRILACVQAVCVARYAREDNVPCQIEEGLFLGSVGAALNKSALKDLNITHILTVAKSLDPAFPNDFVYKKIDVFDTPGTELVKYFAECFSFIDEARSAGGGVLVHCFAGMSRSVTVVVAYLMKKHRMSLSDALSLVRSKRPHIAPNHGFLTQLVNFEKSLGEVSIVSNFGSFNFVLPKILGKKSKTVTAGYLSRIRVLFHINKLL